MPRAVNGEDCVFCCYGCCIAYQVRRGNGEEWDAAWLLIRLGVGGFLSMNIMLFSLLLYSDAFTGADAPLIPWVHLLLWILATPTMVLAGGPLARETWFQARNGRLTSSALILLGAAAAYGYSALSVVNGGPHVYFDTASMVLMLFTLGRFLEASGRARAVRDLTPLLAAESEWASVVQGETLRRRPVREVAAGMLVRIMPGDRVPVDGVIVEGQSHLDEAAITGESRHVLKALGATVIAGSVNLDGSLLVECQGAGSESRWARICQAVRESLSRRSPTTRVADSIVSVLVPGVLVLAGLTLAFWAQRLPFDQALLAALAVLVVACPCAVGLAAPLATSLGIGRLARHGCLVRSPGALEVLARARLIAFDKTGTLTSGRARLVGIDCDAFDAAEVLARAAGLELHCGHSLAQAIRAAAADRGLDPVAAHDVQVVPGRGVRGMSGGQAIAAGNSAFMSELRWPAAPTLIAASRALEAGCYSAVHVGWGGRVRAVLSLDDSPLPDAKPMILALGGLGVEVALLTGDLPGPAGRVAATAGIHDWLSELSPEEKHAVLDRRRRHGHGPVAMVGDGLNDGLVLAGADVGIAVGSATDLARETADIVLPPGGLWMLPWVVGLAREVRATIIANLAWAFGYNLIALSLAALGWLQPMLAAAVMAGSSILVVMNSLRLERLPGPESSPTLESSDQPVAPPPRMGSGELVAGTGFEPVTFRL